jgi:hypothetical protein
MSKPHEVPALFIADRATITFAAEKSGKISVTYQNWDDKRVVLEDRVFVVSWSAQGVEGRIVDRGVMEKGAGTAGHGKY